MKEMKGTSNHAWSIVAYCCGCMYIHWNIGSRLLAYNSLAHSVLNTKKEHTPRLCTSAPSRVAIYGGFLKNGGFSVKKGRRYFLV